MALTKQFMAASVRSSSQLLSQPNPSMQFLETLMATNKIEITTGKLSTAMRMELLLALALMPESNVRDAAKPREVKRIVSVKIDTSSMGIPRNTEKRRSPEKDNTAASRKL